MYREDWDDDERSTKGFVFKNHNDYSYETGVGFTMKQLYEEESTKLVEQTKASYQTEVAKRLTEVEQDAVEYESAPVEQKEEGEVNESLMDNEIYRKFAYA